MDPSGSSEILLYGIASAGPLDPAALSGVGGARLYSLSEEGVTALYSAAPDRNSLTHPSVDDLLAFQRVIGAVHATVDILAARYGCVLPREADLRAHLRERHLSYQAALGRIAGCVELGVRVQVQAPREPAQASDSGAMGGASYLRSRQAHHARLAQAADDLQQRSAAVATVFADLTRATHTQPSRDGTSISVSFLVPRASVPAFRSRFAAQAETMTARYFLLGPWPPFSFSSTDDHG